MEMVTRRLSEEVERAVADVLLHSIRQVDLAARYGGEELTVILLDTPGTPPSRSLSASGRASPRSIWAPRTAASP